MLIYETNEQMLEEALRLTNEEYEGNVIWNRHPEMKNMKGSTFRLTLRVKDSKLAGHRLSQALTTKGNRSRMISACWHVHGTFFDFLFDLCPELRIRAGTTVMKSKEDNWEDTNIGSMFYPLMHSDACDCGSDY